MNKKREEPRTKTNNKTRILVVDDHPVIREGLTQIINRESNLLVCAGAGNIAEAVKAVRKQKIDLALVDMLLNNTTGIQVMKKIRTLCPGIITLVFSMSDNSQHIKQAIEAGARGYITKDEISEDIVNAIRQILKGRIYISSKLLKNLPKGEIDGLLVGRVQGCCD
ncbi:MAG TPA: response regulator transcription factor [Sedimentisphaerales bacterium]|nr:response regulator transcription factor [Sedimentisphaerales bacterium]